MAESSENKETILHDWAKKNVEKFLSRLWTGGQVQEAGRKRKRNFFLENDSKKKKIIFYWKDVWQQVI